MRDMLPVVETTLHAIPELEDEVDEDENYFHKFTLDQKNYGVDCDNDVFEIKSNGDSTFVGTWDPESRFATFNELE